MSTWASPMLIAGGLFAGGAATFAWSRVPIWRRMPAQEFIGDFEETIRRTDKVQPGLAGRGDRLDSRVRPHRRWLGARARVRGRRGLRGDSRRVACDPRAAPAAHRRDAACGRESDRRDARPLVPWHLGRSMLGGIVRGGCRGSDLVITR